MSNFMFSLTGSVIGISVMSWWLYSRISLKLAEGGERNNWEE